MLRFENQSSSKNLQSGKTTVGQISFINALPITVPLKSSLLEPKIELLLETPARLNNLLAQEKLHIGAMSSFFFLKSGSFELFPNLSISAETRVGSVLFFSKRPLLELSGQIISVPDSSASSINMLNVLLREEFGVVCSMQQQTEIGLHNTEIQGALVIGDQALKAKPILEKDYLCYDLGEWWYRLYQLPMVFGVWGARKTWVESHQQEFEEIANYFCQARDMGLGQSFPEVLKEAEKRSGLSELRLREYYTQELNYNLNESHLKGLSLYSKLCKKHELF